MNFTPHKWLPETLLRVINFGTAVAELEMSVAPLKNVIGKKIKIPPGKHFIKVGDLVPAHIKNYKTLLTKNMSLSITNNNKGPLTINIEEYGPYVSAIDESQYEPSSFDLYMAKYNEAIALKDSYRIEKLLEVKAAEGPNVNPNNKFNFLFSKARMSNYMHQYQECDNYYEMIRSMIVNADDDVDIDNETKLTYYTSHGAALIDAAITGAKETIDKRYSFLEKANKLFNEAEQFLPNDEYTHLYKWAFNCRQAFCLCFVDAIDEAIKLIDYYTEPLPLSFIKDPNRHIFFSGITYGLLVALELKNERLIRQITRTISTGFEDMNEEPNAIFALRRGIGNLEENGQSTMFIIFKNLLLTGGNIQNEFPNLTDFLKRLGSKNEETINKYLLE